MPVPLLPLVLRGNSYCNPTEGAKLSALVSAARHALKMCLPEADFPFASCRAHSTSASTPLASASSASSKRASDAIEHLVGSSDSCMSSESPTLHLHRAKCWVVWRTFFLWRRAKHIEVFVKRIVLPLFLFLSEISTALLLFFLLGEISTASLLRSTLSAR